MTLVCGILPFISTVLISNMNAHSHPLVLWLSIVSVYSPLHSFRAFNHVTQFPLGFGNAVVLQTMLSKLIAP